MNIGVIISTDEPEVIWNAFRFGNVSLESAHVVKIFLINRGVNLEDVKGENFNIKEQVELFLENKGEILACGTCLQSRNKYGSKVCPISTMQDLLKIVEKSDKILTFG